MCDIDHVKRSNALTSNEAHDAICNCYIKHLKMSFVIIAKQLMFGSLCIDGGQCSEW